MLKVKDIMTRDVLTVGPETHMTVAAKLLLEKQINGLPVVDEDGRLVGILCQSDLVAQQKKLPLPSVFFFLDGYIPNPLTSRKHLEEEVRKIAAITVAEAMTPHPVTVHPEDDIERAAGLMVDKNYHTLPVLKNNRLVGVVGKEDILRTIVSEGPGASEHKETPGDEA
jgi:CBS domain-containing protein